MRTNGQADHGVVRAGARAIVLLLVGLLALLALPPSSASAAQGDLVGGRFSDCFWRYGAVGVDDFNIAYPDAGATYWVAGFRRPPAPKPGGRFPLRITAHRDHRSRR